MRFVLLDIEPPAFHRFPIVGKCWIVKFDRVLQCLMGWRDSREF